MSRKSASGAGRPLAHAALRPATLDRRPALAARLLTIPRTRRTGAARR